MRGINLESNLINIVSLAVISEGIITYLSQFFVDNQFSWKMLVSILISTTMAIAYKVDFPKYINLNSSIPYIGYILTGILISRGSNYIYDLLNCIIK